MKEQADDPASCCPSVYRPPHGRDPRHVLWRGDRRQRDHGAAGHLHLWRRGRGKLYVASQNFNRWLGEARSERALGWNGVARSSDGALAVTLSDAQGHALAGAQVTAVAEHPLGLRDDLALTLNETAPGHYRASLPAGRWRIKLRVVRQGATGA
jgi:hypothetical protein